MSLQYFIDGHNLLYSTHRWDQYPRSTQRLEMLRTLEEERPMGSERNTVTVVFDGYQPKNFGAYFKSIKILFSNDQDADTLIKESVYALSNPRTAVVVTDDRSIRMQVKHRGAKVLSCDEFLSKGRRVVTPLQTDKLNGAIQNKISEELKRIWRD